MVDYVQRAFDALADKMLEGRRIPDDTFAAFSALENQLMTKQSQAAPVASRRLPPSPEPEPIEPPSKPSRASAPPLPKLPPPPPIAPIAAPQKANVGPKRTPSPEPDAAKPRKRYHNKPKAPPLVFDRSLTTLPPVSSSSSHSFDDEDDDFDDGDPLADLKTPPRVPLRRGARRPPITLPKRPPPPLRPAPDLSSLAFAPILIVPQVRTTPPLLKPKPVSALRDIAAVEVDKEDMATRQQATPRRREGVVVQGDGIWPLAARLVIHELPPPMPMDVLVLKNVSMRPRSCFQPLDIGRLHMAAQLRMLRSLGHVQMEEDEEVKARAPRLFLSRNMKQRHLRAPSLPMMF